MFFLIKLLGKWEDKQKQREMEREVQKTIDRRLRSIKRQMERENGDRKITANRNRVIE